MEEKFCLSQKKLDIKILILFLMRRLKAPVTLDALTEVIISGDDGISYFDFAECVAELVKTEHLQLSGNIYSLTEKGERNGELTESSLPFSVRSRAENATSVLRKSQFRDAMITAHHTLRPDGALTVKLSLSDKVGDIIYMELYAADKKQAAILENGFRRNAESVYNTVLENLLN